MWARRHEQTNCNPPARLHNLQVSQPTLSQWQPSGNAVEPEPCKEQREGAALAPRILSLRPRLLPEQFASANGDQIIAHDDYAVRPLSLEISPTSGCNPRAQMDCGCIQSLEDQPEQHVLTALKTSISTDVTGSYVLQEHDLSPPAMLPLNQVERNLQEQRMLSRQIRKNIAARALSNTSRLSGPRHFNRAHAHSDKLTSILDAKENQQTDVALTGSCKVASESAFSTDKAQYKSQYKSGVTGKTIKGRYGPRPASTRTCPPVAAKYAEDDYDYDYMTEDEDEFLVRDILKKSGLDDEGARSRRQILLWTLGGIFKCPPARMPLLCSIAMHICDLRGSSPSNVACRCDIHDDARPCPLCLHRDSALLFSCHI